MLLSTLASSLLLFLPGATPEATIRETIDAINQSNASLLAAQFEVVDKDAESTLKTLLQRATSAEQKQSFAVESVQVTESGDTAQAVVKLHMSGGQNPFGPETVPLKKIGSDWKIVNSGQAKFAGKGLFEQVGAIVKSPHALFAQARHAAETTIVLSNMKQLAVGVMLLASDNKDKFLLSTTTLQSKLAPYVKNKQIFLDSKGKPLGVVFNDVLTGKQMSSVTLPDETVLLSLGTKKNLKFDGDRTPIAFVDGHVKRLTRAEVAKVRWTP